MFHINIYLDRMSNILKYLKYPLFLWLVMVGITPQANANSLQLIDNGIEETIQIQLQDAGRNRSSKVFTLNNPHRIVVDIPHQTNAGWIRFPDNTESRYIGALRVGTFNADTTRIVFDLNQAPNNLKVRTVSQADNIITITFNGSTNTRMQAPVNPRLQQAAAKVNAVPERPLIVIDAGHGGKDPGAIGSSGVREKKITLIYARALRDALLNTGKYKVAMTRDGDNYLLLRDRVKAARKINGDVFISLHADSAGSKQAQGLSIYTLSETASDKEAEALAARENSADIMGDMQALSKDEQVADILLTLAQRDTKEKSEDLAQTLIRSLQDGQVKMIRNTHRFAGFAVLKAPDIPSVLVEVGFLSNHAEERNLLDRRHQTRIISGLVEGINKYFHARKTLAHMQH